jgi:hypothetical protein
MELLTRPANNKSKSWVQWASWRLLLLRRLILGTEEQCDETLHSFDEQVRDAPTPQLLENIKFVARVLRLWNQLVKDTPTISNDALSSELAGIAAFVRDTVAEALKSCESEELMPGSIIQFFQHGVMIQLKQAFESAQCACMLYALMKRQCKAAAAGHKAKLVEVSLHNPSIIF